MGRLLRVLVACAAVAAGVVPVSGPAAGAELRPELRGEVTVSGTGAASMQVTLPEEAGFHVPLDPPRSPGWARIETSGSYAALALVSNDWEHSGSRVNVLQVHLPRPWGCPGPSSASPCLDPFEHVYTLTPHAPTFVDGGNTFPFAGGDYTLFLVTEPGETATARFTVHGTGAGETTLAPSGPAGAEFGMQHDDTAPVAVVDGELGSVMDAPGIAVMGLYQYGGTEGVAPGPFQYQECLTRDGSAALNPNDCVPMGLAGSGVGDVSVGGQRLLMRPQWFAGSFGGFSLTDSGIGTFESFWLEPGSYVTPIRWSAGARLPRWGRGRCGSRCRTRRRSCRGPR